MTLLIKPTPALRVPPLPTSPCHTCSSWARRAAAGHVGPEAGDYRTRSAPRSSKDARRHARLEIACSIDIKPADDDIIEDS